MTTRRRFLGHLGLVGLGSSVLVNPMLAQSPAVKTIATNVLEIAYEEHGNPRGTPIILLHGFPYDVRSFDQVIGPLADRGFRLLLPYLRGYGRTRFLDPGMPRMAEQAAIAQDLLDFADALELDRFLAAGFDWGNRAACIAAILQPERFLGQVAMGGYSVQDTVDPGGPAPARFESLLWYQWYFNTPRGETGLRENRHDIIRYLWDTWSPTWTYSDADYARSAPSFDNPDFVDVVIHSYRHRHGSVAGEDRFLEMERMLAERPVITVPAVVLRAGDSGFGPPSPDPSADQARFISLVDRQIVDGAGHDLPVQRPDAVIDAVQNLLSA